MRCRVVTAFIVAAVLATAIEGCAGEGEEQRAFHPRLAECTLRAGDATLKPVRVSDSWQYQHPAGTLTIAVDGRAVIASDANTGKPAWQVESADTRPLEWLATDGKTAYFRAAQVDKQTLTPWDDEPTPVPQHENLARVRRLQLSDHQWLKPLDVGQGKLKEKTAEWLVSILPVNEWLLVLTATVVDDPHAPENGRTLSYRVARFEQGRDAATWSRDYPSAGSRSEPGAYLFASRRPDYAVESIKPLAIVGQNVLVCAGAKEDLICLASNTGSEVWRVPRLWEFRRGFIGPSVWTHYIGRYGISDGDLETALHGPRKGSFIHPTYLKHLRETVAKAKARVEAEEHAVIAGPVIVPTSKESDKDPRYSLFVVVARSEKSQWSGYLADCVVYEMSESGKPIGIVNLPRMVSGGQSRADDRGVVWACPGGAFVRLAPSDNREHGVAVGPGGPDMLCRVAWYCQPESAPPPKAWLTADPAGDPVAFSRTHAYRPDGDPYVLNSGDKVYHFPIRKLDLGTGQSERLLLDVPFDGAVDLPTLNYSRRDGTTHAMGSHLLGVTWLDVRGEVLQIVLGTSSGACAVEFDLAGVGPKKARP
jgi:hypothetical protein